MLYLPNPRHGLCGLAQPPAAMREAQGEDSRPLVADEETEAQLNRAAPSPQHRAGHQT